MCMREGPHKCQQQSKNDNPPHASGMVLSVYYLFPKLKRHLASIRFSNEDEVTNEVQHFFNGMAVSWYVMGIQKPTQPLRKYIERNSVHVEK